MNTHAHRPGGTVLEDPPLRSLDWRYFLRRARWGLVVCTAGIEEPVKRDLRACAQQLIVLEPGREPGPGGIVSRADLVVAREDEVEAPSFACAAGSSPLGSAGPTWVILKSSRRSIGRLPRAPRGVTELLLRAAQFGDGTVCLYPAGSEVAQRTVWSYLEPPQSWRGRMARVPLPGARGGMVTLVRETAVSLMGPAEAFRSDCENLIVLSAGTTATNPAIVLRLLETEPRVTKVPRFDGQNWIGRTDYSKLKRLHLLLPQALPQPLGPEEWSPGFTGWSQSLVIGPVLEKLPSAQRRRLADQLAERLISLESASIRATTAGILQPPRTGPWLRSHHAYLLRHDAIDSRDLERLYSAIAALEATWPHLVFQHRDAGLWNAVYAEGLPILLDWESAGWGLPGGDVFYLLLMYAASAQRARSLLEKLRVFERHVIEPSGRDPFVSEWLKRLSRRTGFDSPLFATYLAWICLWHAASGLARAQAGRGKTELSLGLFSKLAERLLSTSSI